MDYNKISDFHKITTLKDIVVTELNFHIPEKRSTTLPNSPISYRLNLGVQVVPENDLIIKDILIDLLDWPTNEQPSPKEKKSNSLGSVHIYYSFHVLKSVNYLQYNSKRNNYIIDSQLDILFNHVIIATSRGIIYSEFRGFLKNNVILPLILPEDLVDKE